MKKIFLMIFMSVTIFAGMLFFNSNEAFADDPTWKSSGGTELTTDKRYTYCTYKIFNMPSGTSYIYVDNVQVFSTTTNEDTYEISTPSTGVVFVSQSVNGEGGSTAYFQTAPDATYVLDDGQNTPLSTGVVYPAGTTVKTLLWNTVGGSIYLDDEALTTMWPMVTDATYTINVPFVLDRIEGNSMVAMLYIKSYRDDEPYNYDIEESLESYPDNEPETAYVNEGTALSNAMMKALLNNPALSLEFSFEYEGEKHVVFIPAGKAVNDDIPWYGPAWLLKHYGEKTDAPRTYEVKKGDTLNNIAKALGTTTDALMKLNPQIKNKNMIYPGQKIIY